jgi:hypothetical protein
MTCEPTTDRLATAAGSAFSDSGGLDESQSNGRLDPDVYLLAAVVIETGSVDEIRVVMRGLARRGQGKLHWSHESDHRRRIITRFVAGLDARHVVVVQQCRPQSRPERRRRLCMERMFTELDGAITTAVFESRGRKDDLRDHELAQSMYDSKKIKLRPQISHQLGRNEPVLWISDAVCGAVTRHRTGISEYLEHLAEKVPVEVVISDCPR